MARRLLIAALAGLSLTGCVSQEKYNALKMEKDQLAEQLGQAQADASSARSAAEAWKAQYDKLIAGLNSKDDLFKNLMDENGLLKTQLASLDEKYKRALDDQGRIVGVKLDQVTSNALEELARQFPGVMTFDSATGMIRFNSDVTFGKGSAELTPTAKQAIARVGQVLNNPAARGYEFLVAGHTDNTPVSNPATIAAGHKNNWYLSSHRAIAVGHDLIAQGIAPTRVGVLGYADQRPLAANTSSDGQAKNRRVEILVLPTSARSSAGTNLAAPTRNAAPQHRTVPVTNLRPQAPALNKDTTEIDNRPVLNK